MPTTVEPARGLSLSDFGGPEAPPDNAKQDGTVDPAVAVEPEKPATVEEPAGGDGAAAAAEPEKKSAEDIAAEGAKSLGEAFSGEVEDEATNAKEEEEEVKGEEADAAAEKAKAEAAAAPARDADLEIKHGPHTHPTTRKLFKEFGQKVKVARDELEQERAARKTEAEELRQKLTAAEERAKGVTASKEAEQRIKELTEKLREADITKDPELVSKYDAPITENSKSIGELLKGEGLTDKQHADLIARPVTTEAVYGFVTQIRAYAQRKLTEANAEGIKPAQSQQLMAESERAQKVAEDLIFHARENERLLKQKGTEIQTWKGGYDQRIQQREKKAQEAAQQRQESINQYSQTHLKNDLGALAKEFPYLKQPAPPLPTDSPNVQKAKQAQLDEYTAAEKKINEAVAAFQTEGVPPEKIPEIAGKISANAVQAQLFKLYIIPKLQRDLTTSNARIKELEAQVARFENAGKISRAHSLPPSAGDGDGMTKGATDLESALGAGPR